MTEPESKVDRLVATLCDPVSDNSVHDDAAVDMDAM